MDYFIKRVGTTYIPVQDPEQASKWYQAKLGAKENYCDENKSILDFANQSFFLVKSIKGEKVGFQDWNGKEHFSLSFEVDGVEQLNAFHAFLKANDVKVGEIEDRGHPGYNFVFYDQDDNIFDVWSVLSPSFKK